MTDEQRINSGSFAKNQNKQAANHADIKGNADVQCPCCGETSAFWLDGWHKNRKSDGAVFYSLSFKPKAQPQNGAAKQRPSARDDLSQDIPF